MHKFLNTKSLTRLSLTVLLGLGSTALLVRGGQASRRRERDGQRRAAQA